jgi:hypothetical protein
VKFKSHLLLMLGALTPAAIIFGGSAVLPGPWANDAWAQILGLVGVCAALVNVPAGLVLFVLHLLAPSEQKARLCRILAVANIVTSSVLLLAASLASASHNLDARLVFIGVSPLPSIVAAPLSWRSRIVRRTTRRTEGNP